MDDKAIKSAVEHFWVRRAAKGTQSATHDKVFLDLIEADLITNGWSSEDIERGRKALIAGHFRPAKAWDIVGFANESPKFAIEYKSQVGSYGNNENNRIEEALGSALDARARFGNDLHLGFIFVLCEEEDSIRKTRERPVTNLDPIFTKTSHLDRRQILLERLLEFKIDGKPLYSAASLVIVKKDGTFTHPNNDKLKLTNFASNLLIGLL